MTQKQLSSELRELMGQLSERAIHQEVSMAQQEQELIVRSEHITIDLPTEHLSDLLLGDRHQLVKL